MIVVPVEHLLAEGGQRGCPGRSGGMVRAAGRDPDFPVLCPPTAPRQSANRIRLLMLANRGTPDAGIASPARTAPTARQGGHRPPPRRSRGFVTASAR